MKAVLETAYKKKGGGASIRRVFWPDRFFYSIQKREEEMKIGGYEEKVLWLGLGVYLDDRATHVRKCSPFTLIYSPPPPLSPSEVSRYDILRRDIYLNWISVYYRYRYVRNK